MPELPEVEMARENLERWLVDRTIDRARVQDRRVLRGQSVHRMEGLLRGARLLGILRRGKYLRWNLGSRGEVLSHLGMTGKFVFCTRAKPDPDATCVVLRLNDGNRVVFSDPRRFGRFQIVEAKTRQTFERIGLDALDRRLTARRLAELLGSSRLSVKTFLMDQSRIGGLGNIYAAEALYWAGIHPLRPAKRLGLEEIRTLRRSIRHTLQATLRRERSREIAYLHEKNAENRFLVYGRAGEACFRCGASVRKIVQLGRSTYYCAHCQPRRPRAGHRAPSLRAGVRQP